MSDNDWKDSTSYARGERGQAVPREWTLDLGGLRVIVHHIHGLSDETWFVSCHAMGIERHELNNANAALACTEALGYCFERAKRWTEKLLAAIGKERP